MKLPLSVLDLSPIVSGSTASQALRNTFDLARLADRLGPAERAQARVRRGMHLIGDPETVRNRILDLVAATGADEVMVTSSIHSHAERLRSYDLLAEAFAQ